MFQKEYRYVFLLHQRVTDTECLAQIVGRYVDMLYDCGQVAAFEGTELFGENRHIFRLHFGELRFCPFGVMAETAVAPLHECVYGYCDNEGKEHGRCGYDEPCEHLHLVLSLVLFLYLPFHGFFKGDDVPAAAFAEESFVAVIVEHIFIEGAAVVTRLSVYQRHEVVIERGSGLIGLEVVEVWGCGEGVPVPDVAEGEEVVKVRGGCVAVERGCEGYD